MEFKPFKIGKYLLLERLATGGMAEVYRAKASGAGGFEKQLAIKRILPTYSENDEFRRMFEYEARLSSMLTHANIVQVYDFVKSGETYLLAMEYVDGKNLRQFVNKARKAAIAFPVEFALFVINEVCKGLEYAHKKKDDLTGKPLNIIHRDMSPQNIMLSYEGAVKIVDFGIAKAKDRADETRSGVIKGKFGYMSPEQANGEPVDHRTDIFSTGIILYELLTGKRLFSAESDMATLRQIQDCVIPQPSRLNPKITAELEKILLKALAKDINLRFQNAGLFHRALLEYLNKHYPAYTQREVSDLLQKTFAEEIESEKRRFEQLYRQSIPFSQGAQKSPTDEMEGVEEALDGEVTRSEAEGNTAITFADEEISVDDDIEISAVDGESGAQGQQEPTPAEPEVSAGGDTQVDSILSDESSLPTQAKAQRTIVGGESASPRKSGGTLRKMEVAPPEPEPEPPSLEPEPAPEPPPEPEPESEPEPPPEPEPEPEPEGREDSVTPTQGAGTKSHITKIGATKTSGDGMPAIIRVGQSTPRKPVSYNKLPETRVQAPVESKAPTQPPAVESSFERKREPQPVPFTSRPPPSSEFELTGAPVMRDRFLREDELNPSPPPPPMRPIFSTSLKLFLMACLIAVGYRTWMEGQVPTLVQMVQPRDPNDAAKPAQGTDSLPIPNEQKPLGDCTLEITTDPLGAVVSVGQRNLGPTPATVSGGCGRAVNITIQMDGFEMISENVVLKRTTNKLYRTLKRLPLGTLELTVNANAKVYLDGIYIGDATANVKFERSLRAKKYRLRLVNDVLGVETSDTVVVNQDAVSRKIERLEPRNARPPASNRPRRPR